MPRPIFVVLAVLGLLCGTVAGHKNAVREDPSALPNLDIDLEDFYYERALSPTEPTLLASTLDGTLVAMNQMTGEVLWELRDEPVVKSPYDASKPILPAFLPDPKDGSIYMIGGSLKDPLKKLPFTIPELVAASPCMSSDGILYTGKKIDTWFSVDRYTGDKQGSISFNGCFAGTEGQCPNLKPANVLIGRTEFNIMMYDSRAEGRRWNISFYDYSSNLAGVNVATDYELAHFADSSTGSLVTLDKSDLLVKWERHIGSPVVAMYRMEGYGIIKVPFTSVSKETLGNLMDQFNAPETNNEVFGERKFFPTLYVGEHEHGLYAMPSLVDEATLTISPTTSGPLLLEGPHNFQIPSEINLDVIGGSDGMDMDPLGIPLYSDSPKDKSSVLFFAAGDKNLSIEGFDYQTLSSLTTKVKHVPKKGLNVGCNDLALRRQHSGNIIFGYYQVPEHSTIKLSPAVTQLQLTAQAGSATRGLLGHQEMRPMPPIFPAPSAPDANKGPLPTYNAPYFLYQYTQRDNSSEVPMGYDYAVIEEGLKKFGSFNVTFIFSSEGLKFGIEIFRMASDYILSIENKELKIIIFLLIVLTVLLAFVLCRPRPEQPSNAIRMSNSIAGSTSSRSGYEFTANPIELDDGSIKVGNIQFYPKDILGKGCEGTFVYKGRFDNRDVAVKRVLAACFSIADREVDLLRESDEHPNVIRYFCMEQDRQFRYIALELCSATLQDFITGSYVNARLDSLTILRQATQGLLHLHTLDIVHRDIKPHNVLISMPGKKGDVRAMISDFGLCKKLKVGRMSFSRRSGVAGTEGWIAPEMMLGNRSNTCAVDIFSLGCVYYFVLSKGHHPFGDSFSRQANILNGKYSLNMLTNETAKTLIEKMLSHEQSLRPTTQAVMRHPLFWSKEKKLSFLQDVSDRVDKEDFDSAIVVTLERGKAEIFRANWHDELDPHVRDDLRKHRSYNGRSVRDLLRALRNKKHHYNELSNDIKATYGRVPDQFVDYWTNRFPKLLIHSWQSMHCIKNEPTFLKYFDKDFDFLQADDDGRPPMEILSSFTNSGNAEPLDAETSHFRPDISLVPEGLFNNRTPMEPNLFEPHFLNNGSRDAKEESQASVISQWDNIDSERLKDHFFRENGPDEGAGAEGDQGPENNVQCKNIDPFPLKESPLFPVDPIAKESPKVRRRIAQLASEAKVSQLQEFEEKKAAFRPTWSEALQNITASDKVAEAAARLCDNNKENCDPVERNEEIISLEESESNQLESEEEVTDKDLEVVEYDEKGQVKPVWVLSPEVPKKSKKNKKKKVKAKE